MACVSFSLFFRHAPAADLAKKNLSAVSGARFAIEEYTALPADHGDARVCLWADDKTAAVTITIDDNHEQDHAFWKKMQDRYGIICTWFVITNKITGWTTWNELADRGHEIQSHTRSHYSTSGSAADFEREYGGSITAIESNVSGHRCRSLAYPNGTAHTAFASQYFCAARGVYGTMNQANTANYLNLNSGGYNDTSRIDVLLDSTKLLWNVSYYRGWSSVHYHPVGESLGKAMTERYCKYVYENRDDLWVDGFSRVARYGQSRDTHTLTVNTVTPSEIRFTLTDEMYDDWYDYPLTVKVRVSNDWESATAVQNGTPCAVSMTSYHGDAYVLVKAVPDRGQVILSRADPSGIRQGMFFETKPGQGPDLLFDMRGRRHVSRMDISGMLLGYTPGTGVCKILVIN